MGLVSEFKEFAMRGNVLDLAVGVVVGGAFGKITSSFVADVLMPPIGVLLGGADFSSLGLTLVEKAEGREAVILKYGAFINTVIDFLIIAFAVFLLVKAVNAMTRAKEAAPPPAPPPIPDDVRLLTEIRDALKAR